MSDMFFCNVCMATFNARYELDNHTAQNHIELKTLDHKVIVQGMPVWDYNLDLMAVDLTDAKFSGTDHKAASVWWTNRTPSGERGSYMNCERVWYFHPSSGVSAARALEVIRELDDDDEEF